MRIHARGIPIKEPIRGVRMDSIISLLAKDFAFVLATMAATVHIAIITTPAMCVCEKLSAIQ
jgi:hypothetical protein